MGLPSAVPDAERFWYGVPAVAPAHRRTSGRMGVPEQDYTAPLMGAHILVQLVLKEPITGAVEGPLRSTL